MLGPVRSDYTALVEGLQVDVKREGERRGVRPAACSLGPSRAGAQGGTWDRQTRSESLSPAEPPGRPQRRCTGGFPSKAQSDSLRVFQFVLNFVTWSIFH